MYDRLKRLYKAGRLSEQGVRNAATKGLITQEQAEEIIASKKA